MVQKDTVQMNEAVSVTKSSARFTLSDLFILIIQTGISALTKISLSLESVNTTNHLPAFRRKFTTPATDLMILL